MRTSSVMSLAIGVLVSLLLVACSSTMTNTGQHAAPAPGKTPQPLVPRQFTEVASADWTIDTPVVGRELECRNGKVRIFDCHDVNLLAYLPERVIGGEEFTDLWGWTDPVTGREFVIAGHKEGTAFVEITDPLNPRYLGQLPRHAGAPPSHWRDIKTYKHYAFIVSEGGGHGVQVFDLTQLLKVTVAPAAFQETAHYDRVTSAHNLVIDTIAGFAYTVGNVDGGETCGGGLHMIDIRTPTAPTFAGCYAETLGGSRSRGYIHDAQCVVYHGPDRRYRGRELCFNAAEKGLGIVDVTHKQQPKPISVGKYPKAEYTHQGWLTEDHRYFFLGDELDELEGLPRTIVFDLQDLQDPVVAKEFFGTTTAIDHNLYIRDRYVYQSNYYAGLRILDIGDPVNPKEVGYFDTTPLEENKLGMSGSWSNYPYFRQRGMIAVSTFAPGKDRKTTKGLFLLRYHPGAAPR